MYFHSPFTSRDDSRGGCRNCDVHTSGKTSQMVTVACHFRCHRRNCSGSRLCPAGLHSSLDLLRRTTRFRRLVVSTQVSPIDADVCLYVFLLSTSAVYDINSKLSVGQ